MQLRNDKKGYKDLKEALTNASKLNESSTPRDVRDAMRELQEAGEAYKNSHNGLFQGIIGSGKERLKLAKEVGELGRFQMKVFNEKCKGMESDISIEANIRKQDGSFRLLTSSLVRPTLCQTSSLLSFVFLETLRLVSLL